MRILLTTPSYPPYNSGLGNAVQQQALAIQAKGIDVVVATAGEQRTQRIDNQNGIPVEEFAVSGSFSLLNPIKGDIEGYLEFLKSQQFDIIIMNAWQTWSSDLILNNLDCIPGQKFLYSHCISTNVFFAAQPFRSIVRYVAWRPYWWKLRRYLKQLDGVIFLADRGDDSRFDDLKLARKSDVPILIVPNSISGIGFKGLLRPVKERDTRSQIISVGSYQWQKGFDFVLKAYAQSRFKNQIPLKFFGQEKTAYRDYLEELASKLGILPSYVSFYDGVSGEALLDEYRAAGLFLSGSHTECQPLVLLDANATGTPFIARRTGCISTMAGGSIVRDVQEAAVQINDILSSQEKWRDMSNAGRMSALGWHHPDNTAHLLIQAVMGGGYSTALEADFRDEDI